MKCSLSYCNYRRRRPESH